MAKKPAKKIKKAKPRAVAATKIVAKANGAIDSQRAVEQFLYRQAELLDGAKWDEWLALFTTNGRYWMPVTESQKIWDGVANIFNEDLDLMKVRIGRVTHPRAHSQHPPARLSHVVSNVVIEKEDPKTGDVIARSKFYAAEFRRDNVRHFAGKYRHHLARAKDGFRIKLQRVDLVNAEGPYDYVIQYWL